MDRRAFLDQEPPPGYIPGIGRGAVGFTTNADSAISRVQPAFLINQDNEDNDEDIESYRQTEAGEDGLLTSTINRDKDDEEADRIYDEIEKKLQSKNKRNTDLAVAEEPTSLVKERFTDLKRDLSNITDEQWANLPEVGDLTRRNKRTRLLEQQQQRFYAVPDSVLAGTTNKNGGSTASEPTNFQSISQARDQLLSSQLDVLLPTTETDQIDIIDADQLEEKSQQVADIKKARLILSSLRKTEPNKANSWIASARLEEQAKNFKSAKSYISEGCTKCPRNESVWLESIRIHQNSNDGIKAAKSIITEALKFNSKSEKLWLKASELENSSDIISRRKILMKGLDSIPSSVKLWRELVNLETESDDVKRLLSKAIELCPQEWEFWLLLINLSEYSEAKGLLNKARKSLKGNFNVWITACKLEERENTNIEAEKIIKMVEKAFKDMFGSEDLQNSDWLSRENSETSLSRYQWIEYASISEQEGFLKTSRAIINTTLKRDLSTRIENNFQVWFSDSEELARKSYPNCSNFIYEYLITMYPNNTENWLKLLGSLKSNYLDAEEGAKNEKLSNLFRYYEEAIKLNPTNELFVLMYSKDKWKLINDIQGARSLLVEGLSKLPKNERLWLANIKLETKIGNFEAAKDLGEKALVALEGDRIWYKHIHLLRFLQHDSVLDLSMKAISLFPGSCKLQLQGAQILLDGDKPKEARDSLVSGIKACPNSPQLWCLQAHIEEFYLKILIKARSTLDKALLNFPNDEDIWHSKISLERRNKDVITARQLTNRALKVIPHSGLIWYQYLSMISKSSQRKNAFLDALKATDNDSFVLMSIGKFFWLDGKFDKAKSWFERSLDRDNLNGDGWGWLYNFVQHHGKDEELSELTKKFEQEFEDINKGRVWTSVVKSVSNFDKSELELLELTSVRMAKEE